MPAASVRTRSSQPRKREPHAAAVETARAEGDGAAVDGAVDKLQRPAGGGAEVEREEGAGRRCGPDRRCACIEIGNGQARRGHGSLRQWINGYGINGYDRGRGGTDRLPTR